MIWLLTRPIVWPVKASAYSAQAGYKTGRFVGYGRLFTFAAGVAVGLLLAPSSGAQLRARIRERLEGGPIGELPPIGGTTPAHDAPTGAGAASPAEQAEATDLG